MNPKICGNSIDFKGTWICRMKLTPCPLLYGDGKCAKDDWSRFEKVMKKLLHKEEVSE